MRAISRKGAKAAKFGEIGNFFFAILASWRDENQELDESHLAQRRKGRQERVRHSNFGIRILTGSILAFRPVGPTARRAR